MHSLSQVRLSSWDCVESFSPTIESKVMNMQEEVTVETFHSEKVHFQPFSDLNTKMKTIGFKLMNLAA